MEYYLILFTLLLTVSFIASDIFQRLRYPAVVGQILAGMTLPPLVKKGASEVFSVIVAMAIVTTLIFPVIMKRELVRNPGVME